MSDTKPEYKGARFYKCALQVNPFGYAVREGKDPKATDEAEYNQKILDACITHGIKVVGLADHGGVDSSESLRGKLTENGIIVFPGFEIASSEKIHMVCLYPPEKDKATLNQHLGAVMGENAKELRENPTHPSSKSCEDIAKMIINEQGGFWYAAHMTTKNGLLCLSGTGNNYVTLWKKENLVMAGQIHQTVQSLEDKHKNIITNKEVNYQRTKPIAIINANDVVNHEILENKSASCLIKMTQPNFEAFRQAFYDSDSRIRLNYEVGEKAYSYIESIQWEGAGFFRKSDCALSKSLNAIIGGRGTGKTTLLESIRYVLGLPLRDSKDEKSTQNMRKDNFRDSKITLHIVSKQQRGERYRISRRYDEAPIVKDEEGNVSNLTPEDLLPNIEFFGQNEILEIEKDPDAMLSLIHGFLPDSAQLDKNIGEIQEKLVANRRIMVHLQEEVDSLEASVKQESGLREQLRKFEALGIVEKLKNVERLAGEDNIKAQIKQQLLEIRQWLGDYPSIDLGFLESEKITQMPNADIILGTIKPRLANASKSLDDLVKQTEEFLSGTIDAYESNLAKWEEQSQSIKDDLNRAMGELPERGGISGADLGKQYSDIAKKLATIEMQKEHYIKQKALLDQVMLERKKLLEEYRNAAFEKSNNMDRGINALNVKFDKKMRIILKRKNNLGKLKEFLGKIQGIGDVKVKSLDDKKDLGIEPVEWAGWIRDKNKAELSSKTGFTGGTVEKLLSITTEQCLQLEEIPLTDKVHIELNVDHSGGERYIPTERLSTGQKCTAILNLLLLSQDDPLIIDQPEDNLDNAFIADRIVRDIRKSKTNRQFVFSTHNANIPVFGDAELIAVLSHEEGVGAIKHQGSIDDEQVRDEASNILEGGVEAFNIRKKKYGF